ncbi:MAG: tetratricopeptide repeat protein [Planctomycetota bacterium]
MPGVRPEVAELVHPAAQAVERLTDRFPDDPNSLDVAAWFELRFGKSEEAVRQWQRCLDLNPDSAEAYFWIGSVARDTGDLEKAADCFRKAWERDPGSPRLPVHLAQALMNLGRMDEAIEVLQKNLKAHPKSMPSFVLLGEIYVQRKEYERGKEYLEAAVEMFPGFTTAYYGLANACVGLGKEEESKKYLEQFKALKARDEKAHRERLKTSDGVSPVRYGVSKVYTDAAKVYLAHGDPETAEEHLLKAVDLSSGYEECLQVLAWLYERQGRTDEALETLSQAREDDPDNVSVHLRLGALHVRRGQFEAAEEAFLNVTRVSPHQAGGYAALANLYLKANRKLPEAREMAQKAVDQEPLARNYFLLSLACQRNGDLDGGRSAIEQAVALDPDDPKYQQLREWLQLRRER